MRVLTTAMKAAPIHRAMTKPTIVPAQIWMRMRLRIRRTRSESSMLVRSASEWPSGIVSASTADLLPEPGSSAVIWPIDGPTPESRPAPWDEVGA